MKSAAVLICAVLTIAGFSNQKCRVYVDGIWDLFHEGHIQLYEQAIQKAKDIYPGKNIELIVGICGSPDQVAIYKRPTIMSLSERASAVALCPYVNEIIYRAPVFGFDEAFLEDNQIDLVIHGDDFSEESKHKYYGAAIKEGKFATVPYTQGISTTQLILEAAQKGILQNNLEYTRIPKKELIARIQAISIKCKQPPKAGD